MFHVENSNDTETGGEAEKAIKVANQETAKGATKRRTMNGLTVGLSD